ncbi:MAG TPA: efflux RND transporter periplasmic adaptor subunit [Gammaproteobacteria bacterium]|nr:efflux RND transporter periplasmic adaptor subunit [Gammaproteobacteria bacterium]
MSSRTRTIKYLVAAVIVVVVGLLITHWWSARAAARDGRYQTAAIKYGDITQTVTATGALNPVVLVSVGTQVSGTVQKLYVDYNSQVKAGQVLLTLDPTLFKAQVAQDQANLASAEATLSYAQSNEDRIAMLYKQDYETKQDLDQAIEARAAAQAAVAAAHAVLLHDQTNLSYTVIRSPVNGTVINRVVDVGQTVAASFNTPTLFTIGKNLKQMQIDTTVDEADVGAVRLGQAVTFTVDAYPNRTFKGRVKQIRLNATTTQNVVTYDVVVAVDNQDLSLLPGMTAYTTILINQKNHVLLVPNAALRVHLARSHAGGSGSFAGNTPAGNGANAANAGMVYVLGPRGPHPVRLTLGITDNTNTEVLSGQLQAGDKIITGLQGTSPQGPQRSGFFRIF